MIILSFFFYKNYFYEETILKDKIISNKDVANKNKKATNNEEIITKEKSNNSIKNLKYEVALGDGSKYEITSEFSQIIFEDNIETILMKKVTATFTDSNNKKLYVNSDNAIFYSNSYNTFFKGNIIITYGINNITSNKLDFNITENNILIYDNVVYTGKDKEIKTDNIKIDIITKNIKIFMNEAINNVIITSF